MSSDLREKIKSIDGLKGVAACMIAFVWHYQHFAPQAGYPFYCVFKPFYDYGDSVVEIFFMLSGLGMVLGYEKRILNGSITFGEYIGKRVKKLFPFMWITLVTTLILQCGYWKMTGTTFIYPNLDVYHFLLNLVGLQNGVLETQWSYNSPSWFIGVVLWCYITFYFIVSKSRGSDPAVFVFKYIIAALSGGVVLLLGFGYPLLNSQMGRGFLCFFLGTLLAKIYQNKDRLYVQRIGYASLLFLGIVWILIERVGYSVLGNIPMAVAMGIAPAIIVCVIFIPWLNSFFSLKPIVYLGKISMSIYLWHFPVQCLWKNLEICLGMEINYSSRVIWMLYAFSVLLISVVYEKWFAEKISKIDTLFVKTGN